MKKTIFKIIAIVVLIIFTSSCIFVAIYFNANKLSAAVNSINVTTENIDIHLNRFSSSLERKIKNNPANYYLVDFNLDIVNNNSFSYYLWRCFSRNNSKGEFKVWMDRYVPESYSQTIETKSIYKGDHHYAVVYKEGSNSSEVKELFVKYVELYVVGLPIIGD